MRSISTTVAATALGVDRKTLDNIVAREARHLIDAGRRGRSRRIRPELLERLAIALVLSRDLGIGVADALRVAESIVERAPNAVPVGSLGSLAFDLERLRRTLDAAVADALEGTVEPPRGRPRR